MPYFCWTFLEEYLFAPLKIQSKIDAYMTHRKVHKGLSRKTNQINNSSTYLVK